MSNKQQFSTQEALTIGKQLGIDWTQIDLEQFRRGLEVELEHGARDLQTNVTGDAAAYRKNCLGASERNQRLLYTPGSA